MSRYLSALLLLVLAPLAAFHASAQTKYLDCVEVSVQPRTEDFTKHVKHPKLHIVIRNQCGIDITAFMLTAHLGNDSDRIVRNGIDLLPRLSPDNPLHLAMPLAAAEFEWDMPLPPGTEAPIQGRVEVDALIFADRTAVGDSNLIAGLVRGRKFGYGEFQRKYEFLQEIGQFEDAKAILRRPPDPLLSPALRAFWSENENNLRWASDAASWADYMMRRKSEMKALIDIFQLHSELQEEVTK